MTTVGILGGGQLARMLALSGAPLGLRFLVLDSTADACAVARARGLGNTGMRSASQLDDSAGTFSKSKVATSTRAANSASATRSR